MCSKTVVQKPTRLVITNTTDAFHPMSAWMPLASIENDIVFNLYMGSLQGTAKITPAIQTAEVRPDNPQLPAAIAGSVTSNGYTAHTFASALVPSADRLFWRFGVMANSSSGMGQVDVGLSTSYDSRGRMLGRRAIDYQPTNTDTGAVYRAANCPDLE